MIGFNYLGKMGQLGNQMFQYASLRGIAKNRGYNFCIPYHNEVVVDGLGNKLRIELFDPFVMSNVTQLNVQVIDQDRPTVAEDGFNFNENIFNESFDELNDGGVLICIHPSTHFINRKPTKRYKKVQKMLDIVSNYKSRLTLVDGNEIFNAGFFTPLSITRVEKVLDGKIEVVYSHIDSTNKEVKVYDKLHDVFIHGNDIVIGIYNKIIPNIKISLEDMLYRNNNTSQKYIRLARISGHPPKPGEKIINPDFFQLIYNANEKDLDSIITDSPIGKRDDNNQFNELVINDTDKVEYIHSYLLTKFSRFCLSLYKNSANILSDLGAVPYMDFSQEWTDEKLFDYFELNQEERDFINTYIPNWYERDFN